MLQELREIMGLTIEQVADELKCSPEEISRWEKENNSEYIHLFFNVFPVNRAVLRYPDADPFLPSYDQTSPGKRMERWMLEYGISASSLASQLGKNVEWVLDFIQNPERPLTRSEGEEIEKKTGIKRKWLMYGDGRNRGKPIQVQQEMNEKLHEDKMSLIEKMAADFEKLPDSRIKTPEEHLKEKKALGLKVRNARKEAGLSIREAAGVLRVSPSRVGQLECGIITEKRAREVLRQLGEYTGRLTIISEKGISEKTESAVRMGGEEEGVYWGERIRSARREAGLSQMQVGALISMSHATVSLMEKGRVSRENALRTLEAIAEEKEKNRS